MARLPASWLKPKAPAPRRRQVEREIQVQTANYVKWRRATGAPWLAFHVPNERRGAAEAKRLSGEGVLAGAPDWVFFFPGGRAAAIELKAPRGSLSKSQRAFRDACIGLGAPYVVCRTIEEFVEAIEKLEREQDK